MKLKVFADVQRFFEVGLWQDEFPGRLRTWLYAALQIAVLACRGVIHKNALIRTSALAYSTILALIPLLALLFALFKGFGIQRQLAAHLLPELAGGSQEFARQILDYVESTQVASLGVFGVVWLLVALVIVMTNVEKAFNETWGVTQARPWWRKLSDYLSIFLIFPVLMAVIISLTSVFHDHPMIRQFVQGFLPAGFYSAYTSLISLGVVWVAFIFIYLVMPNTRIKLLSAVAGGVVGGTIWQVAQWLFLWFQTSVPYYNVIFGALYQILFLVIWMFWSWLIVLFGAEVAYVHQNLADLRRQCAQPAQETAPELEYLALAALVTIADRFSRGQEPVALSELAALFRHQDNLATAVSHMLQDCGLIVPISLTGKQDSPHFLPRQALEGVKVGEVLGCLRAARGANFSRQLQAPDKLLTALEEYISRTPLGHWQDFSLAQLLQHLREAAAGPEVSTK